MRARILLLPVLGLLSGALSAAERTILFQCRGLEKYDIRGARDIDWAWGGIGEKQGPIVVGFSVGPMVQELVPRDRPPGYRWFKVERIGNVTFRYGFHVRKKQLHATLIGAPISTRLNLVASAEHEITFMAVARALAAAPCKATVSEKTGD